MTMKSGFDGVDSAINKLSKISKEQEKATETFLSISSKLLETELKKQIQQGSRSGMFYQKYNPKRRHQASAAGEPPKTDTGRLVNSIDGRLKGLTAEVFSKLSYAKLLEFGTSRIQPRPVWQPTFEKLKPQFTKNYTKMIKKLIDKNKMK